MSNAVKVSEACTLALHTMALLAQDPDRSRTTHEIAETFAVSEAHLSKVLQRLHKAGLVDAVRGPKGGFSLAASPKETTLLDVYETIEGPLNESTCLFRSPMCHGSDCIMGSLIARVNRDVRDYLSSTKLSDLDGVYDRILQKEETHA